MRHKPMHNFIKKQLQYMNEHPPAPGTLYHFEVHHDLWCGFYRRGYRCNCDPTLNVTVISNPPKSEEVTQFMTTAALDAEMREKWKN